MLSDCPEQKSESEQFAHSQPGNDSQHGGLQLQDSQDAQRSSGRHSTRGGVRGNGGNDRGRGGRRGRGRGDSGSSRGRGDGVVNGRGRGVARGRGEGGGQGRRGRGGDLRSSLFAYQSAREYEDHGQPTRGRNRPSKFQSKQRLYAFDTQEYVHATYQFVVGDIVDEQLHSSMPDERVAWDDILQVYGDVHTIPQCPITLDTPPPHPVILPCGHIYSFEGIVSYISAQRDVVLANAVPGTHTPSISKLHVKCPVCGFYFGAKDCRSMVMSTAKRYKAGDDITLQLVTRRTHSSTLYKATGCGVDQDPTPVRALTDYKYADSLLLTIKAPPKGWLTQLIGDVIARCEGGNPHVALHGVSCTRDVYQQKVYVCENPMPMWVELTTELTWMEYKATVSNEPDASYQSAILSSAIECLIERVNRWIVTRQTKLYEAGVTMADSGTGNNSTIVQLMQSFIKMVHHHVFASINDLTQQRKRTQSIRNDFPALEPTPPPSPTPHTPTTAAYHNLPTTQYLTNALNLATAIQEQLELTAPTTPPAAPAPNTSYGLSPAQVAEYGQGGDDVGGVCGEFVPQDQVFMYQCVDGQHIYLLPLCHAVLAAHYTNAPHVLPLSVTSTIVQIDERRLDVPERRNKKLSAAGDSSHKMTASPLSHLPLATVYAYVEIQLSPLVPRAALTSFTRALESRKRVRKALAKRENAYNRRVVAEEGMAGGVWVMNEGGGGLKRTWCASCPAYKQPTCYKN